jgi:cbb3-type cytochrome oxidase maturation protein
VAGVALEILYMLLPLSLAIIALVGGMLWWAVFSGQYDDPDAASQSILLDDDRTSDVIANLSKPDRT